jgi:hypothetical protein
MGIISKYLIDLVLTNVGRYDWKVAKVVLELTKFLIITIGEIMSLLGSGDITTS